PERLSIPDARGTTPLDIDTPDAVESSAKLPNAARAAPALRVRARIVVRAANRAPLDTALTTLRPRGPARKADASGRALRDFYIVDAPTVREAARIARALRATPGIAE